MLFDVCFGLVEDGHDDFVDVVACESFKGPLQQRFVGYREQYFWACAA